MEYLLIFISAIFVNNIVLSQFLGICPFLGVSKKISTSLGMGAAVTLRADAVDNRHLSRTGVRPQSLPPRISADVGVHPRHRGPRSDG